jgi:hypothetical protein
LARKSLTHPGLRICPAITVAAQRGRSTGSFGCHRHGHGSHFTREVVGHSRLFSGHFRPAPRTCLRFHDKLSVAYGRQCRFHGDAVNTFFILFVHQLDAPCQSTAYRGDDGKVVVYATRRDAEAVKAEATAINRSPNICLTVTEFQPLMT